MKKTLFFVAAAALALTACTSEDDILQTGQQKEVAPQEVGFDVYTPAVTATRAGLQGTMTTTRLKRSEALGGGFGVYAYLTEDDNAKLAEATSYDRSTPVLPNFMVNEKLLWNSVNQGWYYNPLKYWPNETNKDSQNDPATMEGYETDNTSNHLDRLTFFAYAPYITSADPSNPGITALTTAAGLLGGTGSVVEASIGYKASLEDPNKAVDLLWGVAPAGGLTYTAVNKTTVNVEEGMPLIDMIKPDVNTNMKFLFQHSLARIGIKAVAAVDQVGAGGVLDPNTKITINKIKLTGYFGETGILNLDNPVANVANWVDVNGVDIKNTSASGWVKKTIELSVANGAIAQHLRFKGSHTTPVVQDNGIGVTTVKQDVIEPADVSVNSHCFSEVVAANDASLAYSESTPYYTDKACTTLASTQTLGTATGYYYTLDEKGVYTCADASGYSATYKYPDVMTYYDITFILVTSGNKADYVTYQAYSKDGTAGTINNGDKLTPKADIPAEGDWVITASQKKVPFYATGTYYKRDANYFMVVPTNNFQHLKTLDATEEKAIRTVTVEIEYYITTEDSKLAAGRAQTKNVVTKDVLFPSLANGKSYNLNLVLGLTSVKIEAEVDDWKVINVQGDLPQNTDN